MAGSWPQVVSYKFQRVGFAERRLDGVGGLEIDTMQLL
jgi:hypothetical protein